MCPEKLTSREKAKKEKTNYGEDAGSYLYSMHAIIQVFIWA